MANSRFRMDDVLRDAINHYENSRKKQVVFAQEVFLEYLDKVRLGLLLDGLSQAAGWVEDIIDAVKSCGSGVWGSVIVGYLEDMIRAWGHDYDRCKDFEMVEKDSEAQREFNKSAIRELMGVE